MERDGLALTLIMNIGLQRLLKPPQMHMPLLG
jgi:hypothetical protein